MSDVISNRVEKLNSMVLEGTIVDERFYYSPQPVDES
jgi:hypothetical protein